MTLLRKAYFIVGKGPQEDISPHHEKTLPHFSKIHFLGKSIPIALGRLFLQKHMNGSLEQFLPTLAHYNVYKLNYFLLFSCSRLVFLSPSPSFVFSMFVDHGSNIFSRKFQTPKFISMFSKQWDISCTSKGFHHVRHHRLQLKKRL